MAADADPSGADDAHSPKAERKPRRFRTAVKAGFKVLGALISTAVVVAAGIAWTTYRSASTGITRSEALADEPPSTGSDQNILIIGLDSRRDQQGRPLPKDLYQALHAGEEDAGEGAADALIVLHLPAGTGPATAISIPRDDYVDLAGCPDSVCKGKVKEAYSLAYQRVLNGYDSAASKDEGPAAKEQRAREAGRKAQISTVRRLLQIPIDHFIEVTLAGFFQIARVVEPITVCLTEDTSDRYYSGAQFKKGIQQISAAQAVSFVRQRRDGNDTVFTDLDRTRRQQAFIVSLVNALRHGDAFSTPKRLRALLDVAKQNVAVDAGFDFEDFVRNAPTMLNRPIRLYTLPVTGFGELANGAYVNYVDVPTIRSIVRGLVGTDSTAPSPSITTGATTQPTYGTPLVASTFTLDVVNASGQEGMAASLQRSLATGHLTPGTTSTAESLSQASTIVYGHGAKAAAEDLADDLDINATESDSIAPNTVQLTVGADYYKFYNIIRTSEPTTTTSTTPVSTVPAAGTGTKDPTPEDLTQMTGDAIPCVK
ncbi:transcriptional regulator [Mycobacterium intermedium]|uniref:Transcriptional regulator n=1 Tax=Mycobacterium intermedium TaxID=28445 RepID=A0A1E3SCM9_MYCIE|nr:LCP family protein [Mycobacterium intermedium]MCV6962344.1 LCP family protein [Mycobacterium intermedium]ODQ99831.1 transcriptional regulator [Mycobacterium intermedium]OPE51893.1 transcriptional regulator [Mycobacterium intermedium]ORB04989.1 transcriptional regulator [Mycobacterium intermedium]